MADVVVPPNATLAEVQAKIAECVATGGGVVLLPPQGLTIPLKPGESLFDMIKNLTVPAGSPAQTAIAPAKAAIAAAPHDEVMHMIDGLSIRDTGLGDIAPPDDADGAWICGTSLDEEFTIGETYTTREDAVAGAVDELGLVKGESFQTGQLSLSRLLPRSPLDIDHLLECVGESLYDDFHETIVESWADRAEPHKKELAAALEVVWDAWIAKHKLSTDGYSCEHVESHTCEVDPSPSVWDDLVEGGNESP